MKEIDKILKEGRQCPVTAGRLIYESIQRIHKQKEKENNSKSQ